jgi:NAD(P)-dependent dehydrogenase (short-subunit alcohol dehydrogenase family)
MKQFSATQWALILGGSSGFGLASAKKLAQEGMSICIVHRDRRGAMTTINKAFDEIKASAPHFISFNVDALSMDGISKVISALKENLSQGKVKLLLHSIAFGNLKPIVPIKHKKPESPIHKLAEKLAIDEEQLTQAIQDGFAEGCDSLFPLINSTYSETLIEDDDMSRTIYSMGTSLLTWTQQLFDNELFDTDSRVIGLTSEGNEIAWRGYAAVSAAKVALESVSRSIAYEYAPYGIRSNIIQAGVTDTKALNAIPGSQRMKAVAKLKNPFKRLTTPEDVANVIALLATDEANWINGALIHVDGGERIGSF